MMMKCEQVESQVNTVDCYAIKALGLFHLTNVTKALENKLNQSKLPKRSR